MTTDSANPDCLVCRKHRGLEAMPGGPIVETPLSVVSHAGLWGDEITHYLGHLFVEPRRHVAGLAGLTLDESSDVGRLMQEAAEALQAVCGADHVYAFVFGDHVPHLHVHLLARYPGAPAEFRGTKVDEWPEAPRGDLDAMAALAGRLRTYLERHTA